MNEEAVKGYVFIQSVDTFATSRRREILEEFSMDGRRSYAGNGWYKITHSILDGDTIKIAAEHHAVKAEAIFNIAEKDKNNGSYEIKGGAFPGQGTFLKVTREEREDLDFLATDNAQFSHFFICHSHCSPNGVPFLRWRIVLKEFSNQPREFVKSA